MKEVVTDDLKELLEDFSAAIKADPTNSYFYDSCWLYQVLRTYDQASKVLEQATANIPETVDNQENLYNLYLLQFGIAQVTDDKAKMLTTVKKAQRIIEAGGGKTHPEVKFYVGSTQAKADPQTANAKRNLESFTKRVCKGGKSKQQFKAQCAQANSPSADVIQRPLIEETQRLRHPTRYS